MAVDLEAGAEAEVRAHAGEGYPAEVCGVLLGRFKGGDVKVLRARRAPNSAGRDRGHRYVLHPRDLVAADDEAAAVGLDVVGFYHSHPNVPAAPSEADHAAAWPRYAYLIVSVLGGEPGHVSLWRARVVGGPLVEELVARPRTARGSAGSRAGP